MVGARSLAMALNRLIDAEIDARNPRTASRELPTGRLTHGAGAGCSASLSLAVFLVAVWQLAPIVRWLWPIPVAGFVIYPYLKRVTWLCAPLARRRRRARADGRRGSRHRDAALASRGRSAAPSRCWIAGFDLFYALFDVGLRPRAEACTRAGDAFGSAAAFHGARFLHAATVVLLVVVGLGLPI